MNTEPTWDLYRTFAAVLREGSLSGGARALGLTQPSAARHIDALESAVGGKLFVRTQRGLSPTDLALRLRPHAEAMVASSAALVRAASGAVDTPSGTVRISASEIVGVEHLPAILTGLRRRHAVLDFELVLSNQVEDLLSRQADIAVRMVEPAQQALIARSIGIIEVGLYAHRDYLQRRGVPDTMEGLLAHDLIGFDTVTPMIRSRAAELGPITRDGLALRADSDIAQLAAVRAGFGIGFVQRPVAERSPDLIRLLPEACTIRFGLWIVMHEDLRSSPSCRAVFDALVDGLGAVVRSQGEVGAP